MTYTDPNPSTQPIQPAEPPRKRHPVRKWLLIFTAVFAAVTAAAVTAAALAPSGTVKAGGHSQPGASASPAAPVTSFTDPSGQACAAADDQGYCPGDDPSPAPSGPDKLAVGQAETLGDSSSATVGTVTVESARVSTYSVQDYGSAPANGYFVVVHVTTTADQSYTDGWDINELDFHVLARGVHYDSGNGNAYSALSDAQSNADLTATLGAGESSSGWMAFDVPSAHGEIIYAPNYDGQPVAEWSY